METYQNTFEMFGDPSPRECESAEQYAESLLLFFEETPWILRLPSRAGNKPQFGPGI